MVIASIWTGVPGTPVQISSLAAGCAGLEAGLLNERIHVFRRVSCISCMGASCGAALLAGNITGAIGQGNSGQQTLSGRVAFSRSDSVTR